MKKKYANRITLLKIWEILSLYSGEDNKLSSSDILLRLEGLGIACDRRTLYGDIQLLCECGYPIKKTRGKTNFYYADGKKLSLTELEAVCCAIEGERKIPASSMKKITDKLSERKNYRHKCVYNPVNGTKAVDMLLYENLIITKEAIENNKKIAFSPFSYDIKRQKILNERKIISPELIIPCDGEYFLVCAENEIFNLAFVCDAAILNEERSKAGFTQKDKNSALEKIAGKRVAVTFICENSYINEVFDMFGASVNLSEQGKNHFSFTAEVFLNDKLFAFVASTNGKIAINAPLNVKNQFLDFIGGLRKAYIDKNG